jgi:hypothetical protein
MPCINPRSTTAVLPLTPVGAKPRCTRAVDAKGWRHNSPVDRGHIVLDRVVDDRLTGDVRAAVSQVDLVCIQPSLHKAKSVLHVEINTRSQTMVAAGSTNSVDLGKSNSTNSTGFGHLQLPSKDKCV